MSPKLLLSIAIALLAAPQSFAQAWVAPKGEIDVSLSYQFSDYLGHLNENGDKIHLGASRAHGLTLGVEYSFSDRFAVSASLPFAATQNGKDDSPTSGHHGIDDGHYHSAWQDYHFEARYNVLTDPLVVTPFIGYVLPTHDYATIGEAGAGRDLQELHVGVNLGRLLDPAFPNTYFDVHLGYVFSEEAFGISTNRSMASLTLGHFFTPRYSARLIADYQNTYGGLTSDYVFGTTIPEELFIEHDRLLQDDHFRMGFGGTMSVNEKLDVYLAYIQVISGANTHYGRGLSLGVSRTFGPSHH